MARRFGCARCCFAIRRYFPVPDSGIICGAFIASSLTIKSPLCVVVSVGLKVTETSHVFPGANDLMH
jgi:hypothetical protein